MQKRIHQAANTFVPALLAVESLGFAVEISDGNVYAKRGDETYVSDDPVGVLGLIRLVEINSWEWAASDDDIERTLRRFGME